MRCLLVMLLAIAAALVFFALAVRACPTAYRAVVVEKKVVEKVVVAEVVPVFVPVFSIGYTPYVPPIPAPPPAPPGPSNADVLRALQQIGQRLDQIERARPGAAPSPQQVMPRASDSAAPADTAGRPGPQSAAPRAAPGSALAVYQTKCAQCHQAGREQLGNGFVLLDAAGQRVKLSARGRDLMLRKCYRREMPPADNKPGIAELTSEEINLVIEDLADAKE